MITRLLQLFTSWLNCSAMKRTVLIGSLSSPYCIIWTVHELLSAIRFFNSLHSRRLQEFNSSFDWLTGICVFCDWTERLLWFWFYETQTALTCVIRSHFGPPQFKSHNSCKTLQDIRSNRPFYSCLFNQEKKWHPAQ